MSSNGGYTASTSTSRMSSTDKVTSHAALLVDPEPVVAPAPPAVSPARPNSIPGERKPKPHGFKASSVYRHRGLLYLLLAQFLASLNLVSSRYLTTSLPEGRRYHALEVLLARMGITMVCCGIWMWWKKVPTAPFGPKGLRLILLVRGLCGFVGVFSVYYAVSYLPVPDATVISFLVPIGVALFCHLLPQLREPFTPLEMLGGLLSLVGVLLIARPSFLVKIFPALEDSDSASSSGKGSEPEATPAQRALAVTVALIGVLGMSAAITLIRLLGKRIHPLISVTYFSTVVTIVSLIGLLAIPSVGGIVIPDGALEWVLLVGVGVLGFAMQFLMTKGVQIEKGGRAGSMIYSQMVFSLVLEYAVWKNVPGLWSMIGGCLILGSAALVAMIKQHKAEEKVDEERRPLLAEEETGAVGREGRA